MSGLLDEAAGADPAPASLPLLSAPAPVPETPAVLKFLSRDEILGYDDATPSLKVVPVPEWNGSVHVRVMSGQAREAFEELMGSTKPDRNIASTLVALTTCDSTGNLLFNAKDVSVLGKKSSKALNRVYLAAVELNRISADGVDDLEKNSGAATSGATLSASPAGTESPTSTA